MTAPAPTAPRPSSMGSPGLPPTAAVAVRGLVKRYDGRAVVDGLDLTVERGSIVALLGPNGAGKTTTVEILEGYRTRDGGTVEVLGLDPARDGARLRPRIGLMLQEGGIYPQARPRELLRLYARFFRDPLDPDDLLPTVGLEAVADTRWRRLSGGERQRLSLALALVGRPELVLLDEPTAGMDPAAKMATRELVAGLRTAGTTVLLTTHELHDVERLADRIVIIAGGRLVAEGTPKELLAGASHRLRLRLERALEADELAELERRLGETARVAPGARLPAAFEETVAASGERLAAAIADTVAAAPRDGRPTAGSAGGITPAGVRLVADGAVGRYLVEGIEPTPALVAALAATLARHGLLVVELRSTGTTLEERYLELVGPDADERGDLDRTLDGEALDGITDGTADGADHPAAPPRIDR